MNLPNPSTGLADGSTGNYQTYGYDNLGEKTKTLYDENGTIRAFNYDVLGRLVLDSTGLLGSGVDSTVRSLGYTYDPNGQLSTASTYGSALGTGTPLNQVQEIYNGLSQLVGEYQSHSGAATTLSPQVQYEYVMPTGTNADGRLTDMVYPNGRKLDYVYNTGLDSSVSRVSSINDDAGAGSGALESYAYLGLDTIVKRTRPNNTDLTYIGSGTGPAGDKYVGLDEFGRVVDQNWQTTSTGSAIDRYQYGYDADSNVMYRLNLSSGTNASSYSELYHANGSSNGYDALDRLVAFSRGALNSSDDTISSPSKTITWSLDVLGNWSGTNAVVTNSTAQSRSTNARNEYTNVGGNTPIYDNNGNLTKDENGQQYVYDAWDRLKQVKNSSGTVTITYSYDALGRRIVESPASGTATDVYFNANNVIEERQSGATTAQYVWGLGYVNDLIERDRNADANGSTGSYGKTGSGLEERLFAQQDSNFNVTSIVDTSGNIVERFAYDAYGGKLVLDVNWTSTSDSKGWIYSFQGGRQDPVSGLIHFDARDYSASLGRWTEPDGGYWDGANVYQSFGGNPVDQVDPLGLASDPLQELARIKHDKAKLEKLRQDSNDPCSKIEMLMAIAALSSQEQQIAQAMHDHGFDLDGFLDKLKEAVENVTKSEKGASKTTKAVFDIASAIHQYKTGEPSEMPKGLESALETGDKISEGAEKWLKFYGSAKAIFDAKDKFNGDEADLLSAVGGLLGNAGSYLPAPLDKLADQYAQLIKAIGGALDGIKNSEEAGERNLEAYGEGYGAAADNQYLGPEWGLGQLRKNGMDAIADALKEQSKCDCGKRSWN